VNSAGHGHFSGNRQTTMRNLLAPKLAVSFCALIIISIGCITSKNTCDAFTVIKSTGGITIPLHPNSPNPKTKPNNPTTTTILHGTRRGAMSRSKNRDQKEDDDDDATTMKTTSIAGEDEPKNEKIRRVYSRPALYDLAVSYRDYEEEVEFLLNAHARHSAPSTSSGGGGGGDDDGRRPARILELAAGPARHCIAALRHFGADVDGCTAVDVSPDMVAYSTVEVVGAELGERDGSREKFEYVLGDMCTIGLDPDDDDDDDDGSSALRAGSFDTAWILLGSLQHLTTNDDVVSCFRSTAALLREGGTMIVEVPHPKETFSMGECTRNGWEVPLEDEEGEEYGELRIIWGDEDDKFDPIRQVRDFTVVMDLVEHNGEKKGKGDDKGGSANEPAIREVVPTRLFTAQEIDMMGRLGGFQVVKQYGALEVDEVDIYNEEEAFRLITVLRKI